MICSHHTHIAMFNGLQVIEMALLVLVLIVCASSNSHMSSYPSAPDDYVPRGPFEITFPPGSTQKLYNVTIVDDAIPENSEFFIAGVYLARPEDASRVIIETPKQPLIEIQDLGDRE